MLENLCFHAVFNKGIFTIYNNSDNDCLYEKEHIEHEIYFLPNMYYNLIIHLSGLKRESDNHVNKHIFGIVDSVILERK